MVMTFQNELNKDSTNVKIHLIVKNYYIIYYLIQQHPTPVPHRISENPADVGEHVCGPGLDHGGLHLAEAGQHLGPIRDVFLTLLGNGKGADLRGQTKCYNTVNKL